MAPKIENIFLKNAVYFQGVDALAFFNIKGSLAHRDGSEFRAASHLLNPSSQTIIQCDDAHQKARA